MGYKFSLQNVLEWREGQEDEAKLNLIQAKNTLEQEQNYLQKLIHENIRLKEKSMLNKRVDVMRQDDLYRKVLNEKIIQQKLIVEQSEHDVTLAERKLLKAYQDKKVMEKLREKEEVAYYEEIEANEQKNLDEFATMTFDREAY
ncbi:MAG TPA: flagellar export protein FliJ [Atopostipes sp.]|nr:flagellar export protein FliJ [Atopostipes sp.]